MGGGGSLSGGLSVQGVSVQGVSVRETPPPYGYVRAIRLLLECILVIVSQSLFRLLPSFNVIFTGNATH